VFIEWIKFKFWPRKRIKKVGSKFTLIHLDATADDYFFIGPMSLRGDESFKFNFTFAQV